MVKESKVFKIDNMWEYKVIVLKQNDVGVDKELRAKYIPDSSFKYMSEERQWVRVSDISEMKLSRFNKLADKLDDIGHKINIPFSVKLMQIIFNCYGTKR